MSLRRKLPALRSSTPTAQRLRRAARTALEKIIPAAFDAMSYHTFHGARYPAPPRPASWSGQSRPCSRFSAVSDTVVTFSLVAHEGTAVHYIQPSVRASVVLGAGKEEARRGTQRASARVCAFPTHKHVSPAAQGGGAGLPFNFEATSKPLSHTRLLASSRTGQNELRKHTLRKHTLIALGAFIVVPAARAKFGA